jgi:hypothetical protein
MIWKGIKAGLVKLGEIMASIALALVCTLLGAWGLGVFLDADPVSSERLLIAWVVLFAGIRLQHMEQASRKIQDLEKEVHHLGWLVKKLSPMVLTRDGVKEFFRQQKFVSSRKEAQDGGEV